MSAVLNTLATFILAGGVVLLAAVATAEIVSWWSQ
jgi:hypothetical protein